MFCNGTVAASTPILSQLLLYELLCFWPYFYIHSIQSCLYHIYDKILYQITYIKTQTTNDVTYAWAPMISVLSFEVRFMSQTLCCHLYSLLYRYYNGKCSKELQEMVSPCKIFLRNTSFASNVHPLEVESSHQNFHFQSIFPMNINPVEPTPCLLLSILL